MFVILSLKGGLKSRSLTNLSVICSIILKSCRLNAGLLLLLAVLRSAFVFQGSLTPEER